MRDLLFYARECLAEVDRLKIPRAKHITFTVNSRAKMRLGLCKKTGNRYEIEIAAVLLDERTPLKDGLKNTLIHEILHTCYGCMKHTGRWKQYAEKVNAAYGYLVKRVAEQEEGITAALPEQPPKYKLICPHCGTEYARHRLTVTFQHPERYRCGKCKKSLKGAQRLIRQ